MKKFLAGAAALIAATLAVPSGTNAQADVEIVLLHGIPGVNVDVTVDGEIVIPGFEPGTIQDLSAFAGQTLENLEVRLAGTEDVAIGPISGFTVPSTGTYTLVAHLDAEGNPMLTPFENDTSAIADGNGRLTVRHTAAAPPVDLVIGDARPIVNAVNGSSASLDIPAGEIAGAQIAPTGEDPLVDVPTVELAEGTNLIVYAVGSLDDDTFTFYTQERAVAGPTTGEASNEDPDADADGGGTDDPAAEATDDDAEATDDDAATDDAATDDAATNDAAGGDGTPAPTAVNTGDALTSGANSLVLFAAAAGMFMLAGGAMTMRRKTARR